MEVLEGELVTSAQGQGQGQGQWRVCLHQPNWNEVAFWSSLDLAWASPLMGGLNP